MQKRGKCGFTLTELIIVIAILAILAGILVPLMVGYIDDARGGVCNTNRGVLLRAAQAQYTLRTSKGEATDAVSVLAACAAEFPKAAITGDRAAGICPSGGTYTLTVASDGAASVACDKHGEEGGEGGEPTRTYTPEELAATLAQTVADANYKKNVYSQAYDADKYSGVLAQLPAEMENYLTGKTWVYIYSSTNPKLIICDRVLTQDMNTSGERVPVTIYDNSGVSTANRRVTYSTVNGMCCFYPRDDNW